MDKIISVRPNLQFGRCELGDLQSPFLRSNLPTYVIELIILILTAGELQIRLNGEFHFT